MTSWLTVWGVVAPAATFVAGSALAIWNDHLGAKRRLQEATEAREAELRARRVERRETFELGHLLDVHAALGDVARVCTQVHLFDLKSAKVDVGSYGGFLLADPDMDQEFLRANRRLHDATDLILDDGLRRQVEVAHAGMNALATMHGVDVEAAEEAHGMALVVVDQAQEALGARIREIYRSQS